MQFRRAPALPCLFSLKVQYEVMDPEFRSHCNELIRRVVHLKDCL